MPDPMRKPITTLTDADWVALTPLFSRRASQWPYWTCRVLRALHLPDGIKLALCWEEYNVIPAADRDRIFRTLDVPGSFLVPLDNPLMRGIGKVMGFINPVSWVLKWADKQFEITEKVRDSLKPAVDFGTDAAVATRYDPSAAASAGSGGHVIAPHHAVAHAGQITHLAAELRTAGSGAMAQVTSAFQPLLTTLHHAHAHGVSDSASYANEVLAAAHRSWQNPAARPAARHPHGPFDLRTRLGEERDRNVIAFTAF